MAERLADNDMAGEERLELNRRVFTRPSATLLFKMPDDSMKGADVRRGDVLLVDRSLTPHDGQFVLVAINERQSVRRVSVRNGEIFIKPVSGSAESLKVDGQDVELVGVAVAFVPVVMEQNFAPSDVEVLMSDPTFFTPPRFVILSPMNWYGRAIVGADGEVFTLGWKAIQELAEQQLIDQPVYAGSYRIDDDRTLNVRTEIQRSPPLIANLWSEPLLGVSAVYVYRNRTFYYWVPER